MVFKKSTAEGAKGVAIDQGLRTERVKRSDNRSKIDESIACVLETVNRSKSTNRSLVFLKQ